MCVSHKQKIPLTNNYRRELLWWHSASGKYTCPSRNPATQSGMSSCRHRPHVNVYKMEYMHFNQRGNIFTLNSSSLKQVDKFTYQGTSVSSTGMDINTHLAKAWTAISRLLVIWKSWLIKWNAVFFPRSGHVNTAVMMHYMDAN